MAAVLLPIKPEHAFNILKGNKTLDLRKSVPKWFKGWVYVYVTKGKRYLATSFSTNDDGYTYIDSYYLTNWNKEPFILNGTIPFRFWFDEYEEIKYEVILPNGYENYDGVWVDSSSYGYWISEHITEKSMLNDEELEQYGKGKDLYAWHIKNIEVFDKPMQLCEFTTTQIPNNAIIEKSGEGMPYFYIKERRSWHMYFSYLTKAPQSYMFVYVKEELK